MNRYFNEKIFILIKNNYQKLIEKLDEKLYIVDPDDLKILLSIKDTSARRISVSDGEFVILDRTSDGRYHGHVRKWSELSESMKAVFRKEGLANKKGKIIK